MYYKKCSDLLYFEEVYAAEWSSGDLSGAEVYMTIGLKKKREYRLRNKPVQNRLGEKLFPL